jgi:two-component sensor histidine kinase
MLKAKIATIISLLLIPILVISCGPKSKSKLITEERELMRRLEEQIELTPKQVEQFKESLENKKDEESVEDLSNLITELETFKEMLKSNDKNDQQAGLSGLNGHLQEYIPKLYTIHCHKKARRIIATQILLLGNIKQQTLLKYTR